ncbi:NADPH-dependent FMN reductase [Salisediminibacterium beveridgei]|uniref:FMN reductase n=1 Tax=Salisediminibacterium beveridgei TaxID=632773 RepID=A0A1D7QXV8_9BACI|nr:NADPH-dependent FMN reductase [Salisediminibacterium beveridgei]AOM83834.1 FMN reductase [Salisediminibacterium beveridgei]
MSGSVAGSKTRTALNALEEELKPRSEEAEFDLPFSDGRHFLDYEGDAATVKQTMMDADLFLIGASVFQGSIPGSLKNVFDLLPVDAFRNKVAGIAVTAGSAKHFLVEEHRLKPILNDMKLHVVQAGVFAGEADYQNKKLVNDDVIFR